MSKLILGIIIGLFTCTISFAQQREQMQSKARNFSTFENIKAIDDVELSEFSSMVNHPEYGTLPYNAPCSDCFELIEERTQFSRKFLRSGKNGKEFLIQKGYSALHYKNNNGQWVSHDPRLKKSNQFQYYVSNKFYEILINTQEGWVSLENKNKNYEKIKFHKGLVLEKLDANNSVIEEINADWSNFTAGNGGVKIIDIFPNIDFEININGPAIKTNFIVKSNPGFHFQIKEKMESNFKSRIALNEEKFQQVNLFEKGENSYRFSEILIYDSNKKRDGIKGFYSVNGDYLLYSWDQNQINTLQYPYVIDPTVTSNNTLPQASIIGSGLNNFGAFTNACTYNLSVPTPTNCTITDIDWTFTYIAQNGAVMSEGACRFLYGGCISPAAAGFFWFCNDPFFGGTCAGTNISIFTDFQTCVPAPQCAPYNMDFTMEFFDAFGGAVCDAFFIGPNTDWTMTITGETVDEPAPPTSSNGLSICPGQTTVLNANGVFGVPAYNYSWTPTANLDNPNIQSPTFTAPGTAGNYTYTCTITDACGITATNDITITVPNGPDAGSNGTLTLCDNSAPVDLTLSLGGSPDGGGSWAPALSAGGNTFDPSLDGSGTYTYTVPPAFGCPAASADVVVTVNNQPDAGLDGNTTLCNTAGSTVNLNTLLNGADAGGTWAETTGSGQFTPGTGVFDANGLTAGTYSFTYTLTGTAPCTDDVSDFDVVVNESPDAGGDGNSTLCNSAGSTIDLNTLLSGADPGGAWAETTGSGQFTPGTGVFDANGLTPGTYSFTYTVTGTAPCLDDVADFDIVVSDNPNAGADGNSTLCNAAGTTLDLNTLLSGADPGGTWAETTGSGQFTPGTGVFDASGLTAGTYTFTYTITATAPCMDDFATFDVIVSEQPVAGADGNSTLCNTAGTTIDLNTLLSGADPGGTWAETTSSGQFNTGTGVFDASGLTAGTYTFTYTLTATAPCMDDFATFDITVNEQPEAGLDAASSLCNSAGSTLDLNTLLSGADPGGTWAETTASGQFNTGTGVFDASGLTAGTYTFTYTLTATAPCMDDFATFDITVTGTVTAGNDNSTTICSDNGVFDVSSLLDVGATGGGSWSETSGTPSGQFTAGTSSLDPSGLNGTYTFMYTLAGSGTCLGDDATMTVTVNPFVDAGSDGTDDLCNSAGTTLDLNTLLSGADPGGTWAETTTSGQFNTGTGVFDASGLAAGTYTFTYTLTSAAPCANSVATFDINISDQPDAGLDGASALCNSAGSTIDLNTLLSGADPGGTWAETTSSGQFTPGTGVFDASGLTPGVFSFTYTLTATAPCMDDVATFDITVTSNVTAGADNAATICSDNGAYDVSSLLDPTATAGGTWSETSGTPSGQFNTGSASLDPTGLNGVYTFMYTLAASGSCLGDDATMTITINPAANAGADGNSTICNDPGSTIDLNTLLSGADPGGTWAETSGSGQFTPGTGIFDASGLTAGTYNFTYTITGTAPCGNDVADFVITVTGTPDAGLDGSGALCNTAGSTIDLNTLLSGADPGGTWVETTASGQFNAGTGVFDASGLAGGIYTFEYTVGGTGSCPASTATFDITVNAAPPAPTLGGGGNYCENTNASLTANGTGGTISWYTDAGLTNLFQTGSPITFTVPLGTTIFYVVEDNGCQGEVDTISVTGIAGPTLSVPPIISGCEGDVLTIDASSNASVIWSTGDTSLSITINATVDTFVVATVFASCDTLIDTTFINVFPGFDIDAGPDQTLPLGATTTIEATSTSLINGITWSPSTFLTCPTCTSTDVNAIQTVTYLTTAVDENGCVATDTITITIDGEITIYIPNIFSPNNDGENDDFGPYGPAFETFTMEIYNRWGGIVFKTDIPGERWKGVDMNGNDCPQAVFTYRIRGKMYAGQVIERAGTVMLTR